MIQGRWVDQLSYPAVASLRNDVAFKEEYSKTRAGHMKTLTGFK